MNDLISNILAVTSRDMGCYARQLMHMNLLSFAFVCHVTLGVLSKLVGAEREPG